MNINKAALKEHGEKKANVKERKAFLLQRSVFVNKNEKSIVSEYDCHSLIHVIQIDDSEVIDIEICNVRMCVSVFNTVFISKDQRKSVFMEAMMHNITLKPLQQQICETLMRFHDLLHTGIKT